MRRRVTIKEARKVNEKLRHKGREFADFLRSLPQEQRNKVNAEALASAKAEYTEFQTQFAVGQCFLCKEPLSTFNEIKPCLHWLLKPDGFKKRHFSEIIKSFRLSQIQSYLRWVANQEGFARNINDLPEEGTGNKIIELTVKYKNLEWSISCSESDYMGHENSLHAKHPHYHFQMRVNDMPFIDYNDFHILFEDSEVIEIEAARTAPAFIRPRFPYGEGMNDVLDDDVIEHIINASIPVTESGKGPLRIDTFAYAEDGKKINSDDLLALIEEARTKGVTLASLIHKLPNATSNVVVSPADGVIQQSPRSPHKKR
jgi:hypothetical protein